MMNIHKKEKILFLLKELEEEEGCPMLECVGALYASLFMKYDIAEREKSFERLCRTIEKIGINVLENREDAIEFIKNTFKTPINNN